MKLEKLNQVEDSGTLVTVLFFDGRPRGLLNFSFLRWRRIIAVLTLCPVISLNLTAKSSSHTTL